MCHPVCKLYQGHEALPAYTGELNAPGSVHQEAERLAALEGEVGGRAVAVPAAAAEAVRGPLHLRLPEGTLHTAVPPSQTDLDACTPLQKVFWN